jgi:hypothetical protein
MPFVFYNFLAQVRVSFYWVLANNENIFVNSIEMVRGVGWE